MTHRLLGLIVKELFMQVWHWLSAKHTMQLASLQAMQMLSVRKMGVFVPFTTAVASHSAQILGALQLAHRLTLQETWQVLFEARVKLVAQTLQVPLLEQVAQFVTLQKKHSPLFTV